MKCTLTADGSLHLVLAENWLQNKCCADVTSPSDQLKCCVDFHLGLQQRKICVQSIWYHIVKKQRQNLACWDLSLWKPELETTTYAIVPVGKVKSVTGTVLCKNLNLDFGCFFTYCQSRLCICTFFWWCFFLKQHWILWTKSFHSLPLILFPGRGGCWSLFQLS